MKRRGAQKLSWSVKQPFAKRGGVGPVSKLKALGANPVLYYFTELCVRRKLFENKILYKFTENVGGYKASTTLNSIYLAISLCLTSTFWTANRGENECTEAASFATLHHLGFFSFSILSNNYINVFQPAVRATPLVVNSVFWSVRNHLHTVVSFTWREYENLSGGMQ